MWAGKHSFANSFVFAKIFIANFENRMSAVVYDCMDMHIFFKIRSFFIIAVGYVVDQPNNNEEKTNKWK